MCVCTRICVYVYEKRTGLQYTGHTTLVHTACPLLWMLLRFLGDQRFKYEMLFFNPGITNYEEYSLIQESVEDKKEDGMGTLKKDRTLLRDERKMEKLKAKLHTDDDCELNQCRLFVCGRFFILLGFYVLRSLKSSLWFLLPVNWLDHSRTFREQGVDDETLLLRRKFFYSDQNVDSRDPVQLNLLYVQV